MNIVRVITDKVANQCIVKNMIQQIPYVCLGNCRVFSIPLDIVAFNFKICHNISNA